MTATTMATTNSYLNVLRALEAELFPVVAVERSGTFRAPPPRDIKIAEGLSGLTIIFVAGVSALCFVKRRSRVSLSTLTAPTNPCFSPTGLFLFFTLVNSTFALLYLSHVPDPHHIAHLVTSAFRQLLLLAQALSAIFALTNEIAARIGDNGTESEVRNLKWFRGSRFRVGAIVASTALLLAEFAVSFQNLFASLALRKSFFNARVNLLLLATSPTETAGATTTSIMRVMAGPIQVIQRDLQRLRRSEIGKDTVQIVSQVSLILFAILLLSKISSHIPRFAQPLRTLPKRIRFKRASSISKLPVAVVEEVPIDAVVAGDVSLEQVEIRRNTLALAALTVALFLFTMLSNFTLVLDVLGRRWTAPVPSFGPTQLWSSFLYLSLSLSTLLYIAYSRLFPSASRTSPFSSISSFIPLARLRNRHGNVQTGYTVPPTLSPLPSPPISLSDLELKAEDKNHSSSSGGGEEEEEEEIVSPRSIDAVPVLTLEYPFILTSRERNSIESITSGSASSSSSSSVGFDTRS